ncbi:MAG: hypothetical protein BMS9Abin37_1638 [Acidobacteriota bacterium]|nr:MAG: hypothetical protein BMS9Abin37_1638 [Acidobacteriota bacterium]
MPGTPITLDIISLPLETAPTDILLTENTVIVASENQAVLVNVVNPQTPVLAGDVKTIGGVLAVTEAGLLLSTPGVHSVVKTNEAALTAHH